MGLRDLGHDVLWLDVLVSTGTQAGDERLAQLLLKRFEQSRLRDVCALLVVDQKDEQDLRTARPTARASAGSRSSSGPPTCCGTSRRGARLRRSPSSAIAR